MTMERLKIGVLGTGDVGRALGSGLVALGHEVKMGSRDPKGEKVTRWIAQAGAAASGGTFAEAAAFGEVVVLATLWAGTRNAIDLAGPANLAEKVVIDTTNPLDFSRGMPPRLAIGHTDSAGEQVQRWLPGARVVKAFNCVGNAHMVNPSFPGGKPDMFICGNDEPAKKTVSDLCAALGWPAIDIGAIDAARYLEPLSMVWVSILVKYGTSNHAFALLRK
jgi:predicted dinucleotide-binding enzyme